MPSETNTTLPPKWRGPREPFSGASHFAGFILSAYFLVVLLQAAHGRIAHIAGFLLFGASLILLYGASTLYHSLHLSEKQVLALQRLDYIAIFLLIAGTYAPLCLVTLRGPWGYGILAAEYALAITGIVCIMAWRERFPDWLRVTLYVVMGWLVVVASGPLGHALPRAGVAWLVAGGLIYSVGTVIFATNRPNLWPGKFSAHDLWHLFVLGGSACHMALMLLFVA